MSWKTDNHIEDYLAGYPASEARFLSIREWREFMTKNGFVYDCWKISLGYCGPTDCCLKLHNPEGQIKEFGIESEGWIALNDFWDINKQQGFVPIGRAKEIWTMEQ